MRSDDKRSRERIQWSDLDKHQEGFHLTGTGEAQAIVYFGMGFSLPPTIDYSSLINTTDLEVKPNIHVTPRGSLDTDVDPNGLSNHSQTSNDIIQDPGFEGQGQWSTLYPTAAAEIPTTEKIMRFLLENDINMSEPIYGSQLHWLPMAEAYNDNPPTEYWSRRWVDGDNFPTESYFQGAHLWAQTDDVRERWSLTSTQTHDMGIGEAGKYSATTTIGANGYTNWLIPLNNLDYFWVHEANEVGLKYAEHFVYTTRENTGVLVNGGTVEDPVRWLGSSPPPFLGGFEGFAHVKSDQPSTLESKAVFHHWDGDRSRGEAIGDRDEILFTNEFLHDIVASRVGLSYYRIIATVEDATDVAGGAWQRVDITLPYQGKRSYPLTYSELDAIDDSWPTNPFWRLMYRIKGVPGTTVYMDNVYAWRQLRNVVPIITVGVESWIRDDSGVYIGANLWFKVGQPILGET